MTTWIPTLVDGHRAGDWKLPADLVKTWAARVRLAEADTPDAGTLPATNAGAVKALLDAALSGAPLPGEDTVSDGRRSLDFDRAFNNARRDALRQLDERLSKYDPAPVYAALQAALDETVKRFRADVAAAGPWAGIDPQAIPLALLDEPAETIEAIKRILGDAPRRYMAIRTAWALMRGPGMAPGMYGYRPDEDPNLPTAEVRNWHEIAPDWKPGDHTPWWKRGMVHQWLADLIGRGAELWTPTARQQLLQHIDDFPPEPPRHGGGSFVDPFAFAERRPAA